MKRKILLFGMLFGVFLLLIPAVFSIAEPGMVVEKITPQPADPGETVSVNVITRNTRETSYDFNPVEVETPEKIEFLGRSSKEEPFNLCENCQRAETFYFKVLENANSGKYPILFYFTTVEGNGIKKNISLEVDGTPKIVILPKETKISPGNKLNFSLNLKNAGADTASNLVVDLSGKDAFSIQPSYLTLGSLEPGEEILQHLSLKADKSLDAGLYNFEIISNYRDEDRSINDSSKISIEVLEKAETVISDLKIDDLVQGKETEAVVEVENLGPGEAEKIISQFSCQGAEVTNNKSFIGQLDEDESVPTLFRLTPKDSQIKCTLDLSYEDNRKRSTSETFVRSVDNSPFPVVTVLGIGLLLGIGAIYYWKKRKERSGEEEI